jgi:hypothetical protein
LRLSIFHGARDLSRPFSASILAANVNDQQQHQRIDKPEPRWQALLAFLAIGGIYLALPRNLVFGPIWLLPTIIVVLLVPTVVSHRVGKRSLNRALGNLINGITTLALIGSVALLVRALPSHKESPLRLLLSGGLLWLTNVIVFALWYWRLDGGGATKRHEEKKFGTMSAPSSSAPVGARALSIICSSPSPKARPSARPTRRFSRAGPKFSP